MSGGLLDSGIIKYAGAYTPGWTSNMRLTVAASGLKIVGYDGNDLSSTNPGWATVYSATPGNTVPLKFTSSPAITGANIQGRVGTTASVAWGNAMPLYFGIANVDDTAANADFYLSRCPLPCWQQTVANEIGKAGTAAVTSAQDNIIIWDSGATVGDYASKPLTTLGSCTGTIGNSAGGVTTIGALTFNDGIGLFQEGVQFTFPAGQNGNVASYYWYSDASADIPTYVTPASITASYYLTREGIVQYQMDTAGAGNCTQDGGAGAVLVYFGLPLAPVSSNVPMQLTLGKLTINAVNSVGTVNKSSGAIGIFYLNAAASDNVKEDNWGDSISDDVALNLIYQGF